MDGAIEVSSKRGMSKGPRVSLAHRITCSPTPLLSSGFGMKQVNGRDTGSDNFFSSLIPPAGAIGGNVVGCDPSEGEPFSWVGTGGGGTDSVANQSFSNSSIWKLRSSSMARKEKDTK